MKTNELVAMFAKYGMSMRGWYALSMSQRRAIRAQFRAEAAS